MKLDRNLNADGKGKYALVLRRQPLTPELHHAMMVLVQNGIIDFGGSPDTDFFVIRLKDKFAGPALHAYAEAAKNSDPEWSGQVRALAFTADHHPNKQQPT